MISRSVSGVSPNSSWNAKTRDWLIEQQDMGDGHPRGSWSPQQDKHGTAGGRVMTTALAVLVLEVYYRGDRPMKAAKE